MKKKYKCVVSVKDSDTLSMTTPVPNIIVKEPISPTPAPESAKNDIFSKLDIVEKRDLLEGIYNNLKKTEGADSEKVAEFEKKLGKQYIIVLSDKSREAVIDAITMLIKEPYVKYADPNYICEPAI